MLNFRATVLARTQRPYQKKNCVQVIVKFYTKLIIIWILKDI